MVIGTFSVHIPKTVMGPGAVNSLGNIIQNFGAKKVLIVTDKGVMEAGLLNKIRMLLEKAKCKFDVFDGCLPNAPTSTIDECNQKARDGGYHLLIGIGGGSVMDSTKVVSVIAPSGMKAQDLINEGKGGKKVLPKILIPTTSGTGSEWGIGAMVTDDTNGLKKGLRIPQMWADAVIVDPELTLNLPQRITADTGMDALTHAIEGYVSARSSIVGDMLAETAIKLIADNLRLAYVEGQKHLEARHHLSIAASLALASIMINGIGLAHAMDACIVERTHISHGAALTILLPHVMEFNLMAAPKKFGKIAELMGEKIEGLPVTDATKKSVEAVRSLARDLDMILKMSDVGIMESDIPEMAKERFTAMSHVMETNNPRNVSREDIVRILRAAL